MKTRIKLNQIVGLYMVVANETSISYEQLQEYIGFVQNLFAKNNENAYIVYSSEELKDLKYGRDDYFTANHFGIESKVSIHELNKNVISFIETDILIATYNHTKEFLNKRKQNRKTKTIRNKKDEKSL